MPAVGAVNIRLGVVTTDFVAGMKAASTAVGSFVGEYKSKFGKLAGTVEQPKGAFMSLNRTLSLTKREMQNVLAVGGKVPEELMRKYKLLQASVASVHQAFDEPKITSFADRMRGLGSSLSAFGRSMTTYVTAPLLLAGATMFNTYAEIDGMQRGLKVFAGSAEVATTQFNLFREAAKLPGLGLEEAVQGGLRLEALGYNALTATRYMKEFGNAIALGGGGKVQFDSVLTQLTQMSGKSKVLAEDLKPIVNASPAIAKAITDLFGTVDSEQISGKLQAAGKGPKDFIEMLVAQLSKLERVTGGPKNAIENLGDAWKVASFEFGKAADETLGLTGMLEGLGSGLESAATGFGGLGTGMKATILVTTGLVAAVGPLTLGLGGIIQLLPVLRAGWAALISTTGLMTLGIGAAVVAIGTIAYSVYQWTKSSDEAISKQALLKEATTAATQSIGAEMGQLNALVAVARDENNTKEQRLNAIKEINAISPKYLDGINLETINTQKATDAIAKYSQVLMLKAKAQYHANKYAEAQGKLAQNSLSNPKAWEDASNGVMDYLGAFMEGPSIKKGLGERVTDKRRSRITDNQAAAAAESFFHEEELKGINAELAKMGELSSNVASNFNLSGDNKSALEKDKARLKELKALLYDYKKKGIEAPAAIAQEYQQLKERIDSVTKSLKGGSAAGQSYFDWYRSMQKYVTAGWSERQDFGKIDSLSFRGQNTLQKGGINKKGEYDSSLTRAVDPFGMPSVSKDRMQADMQRLNDSVQEEAFRKGTVRMKDAYMERLYALGDFNRGMRDILKQGATDAIAGSAEIIGGLMAGTAKVSDLPKFLLGTLGDVAMQLGKLAIGIGVGMESIKLTFRSFTGIGAIAAGVGLVALGAAFKAGANKIGKQVGVSGGGGLTPFADGGIVYGPTQALVGEYSGARNNPEVIAPLNKLKDIMGGTGGVRVMIPEFRMGYDAFYIGFKEGEKRYKDWGGAR